MKLLRVPIFPFDQWVARSVARAIPASVRRGSGVLTWLADERFTLSLSAGFWLVTRLAPRHRHLAAHALRVMVATAVAPHLLKAITVQERPDRAEPAARLRGFTRSGKAFDAFPSGHAVHLGGIAAMATRAFPRQATIIWLLATTLGITRILVLAHWPSDVAAGLALGAELEHLIAADEHQRRI
ncbi:phosphatase PAP2 family protein [Bosea sp. 2KB_26]|uniref:phosphatase PAP2 family protein n=1 Tax=Bosea sp. 2KB_26 TaxID=3237475 RepID=UPI003F90F891